MSINVSKYSVMVLNQKKGAPVADYTLANTQLKIVEETKYLSVVLQSNLKFDKHIQFKTRRARQQLGMIKRVLYDTPEKAKPLAYTRLCRPHLEHTSTLWDPSAKQLQHELDMMQNDAIQFICKLKGRDGVTGALEKLDVQTLSDRRKTSRCNLLLRLLPSEENHCPLIDSYDELMTTRTSITWAAKKSDPLTIYAKSSVYHNSFLLKTVREFKPNFS